MSFTGKKLFTRSKTLKKKHQDSRDDLDMDHHLYAAHGRKGSAGPEFLKSSKSNSLGSVTSEPRCVPLEQEDFLSLMHDVRNFSDALGKLKEVFQPYEEGGVECDMRVSAHEKLGVVLSVLRSVLQKCPALHTTDVLTDAVVLISKIKSFHYEDVCNNLPELHSSIDQLALDFSISVSEYLMGDVDTYPQLGKTKSYDNLATADSDMGCEDLDPRDNAEELDAVLLRLENGMDLALLRAKAWSKYTKEILSYVEKRAILECDFAKGLSKLATVVRQNITEDSCLPFQSIYCSALDQDLELAATMQSTCTLIQTQKFLEPLTQQRHDHEKVRKTLKDQWNREVRKMQEAISNLRKARMLYTSRQQEYEKAKEVAQKAESESLGQSASGGRADRKKKLEDEAMHRAMEAETTYKGSVAEANNRQKELERTKADNLAKIRDLIQQCDQIMKTATVSYFQLQQTVTAPLPVQYKTLCESSKQYEPGWQYDEFVRRLTAPPPPNNNNQDPFVFEPYSADGKLCAERKQSTQSSGSGSSDVHFSDDSPDKLRGLSPLKAWSAAVAQGAASDTDSISGSSCKSAESSPSASPCQTRAVRSAPASAAVDEPDKDHAFVPPGVSVSGGQNDHRFQGVPLSRAAQTHVFKKLRTPSRCRECESYVYFNGADCEKCGLTSHRRCLEMLHWECGHDCTSKPLQRRMTTFGVDLNLHVQETHTEIPILVHKCCEEIDTRGLQTKGIYRLSGVKSRVEKLCQSFETDEGNVDLSEHHPNVIANVLKLYLRQLPEPLLTYHLYPVLLALIKEDASAEGTSEIKLVQRLNNLLADLPTSNFRTLALLMHHLKRVTEHEEVNQMSASNLGIVFGPTLLRPDDGAASLNSLMDTPHQTKIVELLITHVETFFSPKAKYVFGPEESPPSHKPPAPLPVPVPVPVPTEPVKPKETPVENIQEVSVPVPQRMDSQPQPDVTVDVKDAVDASPGTSPSESKWYMTGGESLLDELAREEPRFIQPSEEFMALPGTPSKADQPEKVPRSEEAEKGTPSSTTEVHGSQVIETPKSSLVLTPVNITNSSSPGLRRRLLQKEVLHKSAIPVLPERTVGEEGANRRSTVLSQPKVYSPPVHRRLHRVSGVKPASRTTDSLDLATPNNPTSQQPPALQPTDTALLSRSIFYAPNVIQSPPESSIPRVGSLPNPTSTSSGSSTVQQNQDRAPEFV